MYVKEFEIRWSDIDANRHLGNSAYVNFMSHTRMAFLIENGFGHKALEDHRLGPVVFQERIHYFREIFPGKPLKVSLELRGLSEDGMFFEFLHNFYDHHGKNVARGEMLGGWINLDIRKLTGLPSPLFRNLQKLSRTEDFKILTKEDTRTSGEIPLDKDPKVL